MMYSKAKRQLILAVFLLFQCSLRAFPGLDDGDGDLEGSDPLPVAAIDSSLFLMVLIALLLGYFVLIQIRNNTRIK